jgi:hypothetical protein
VIKSTWLITAGILGLCSTISSAPVLAQFSPNCERNGKKDYCALTPIAGATTEKQSFDMITFADHTVYEALRNETSCKNISEKIRTCNAKLITPPGSPSPVAAFYRGTSYEGGYKHEYVGKGIHIVYFYLD